jgi:hypothetical protein
MAGERVVQGVGDGPQAAAEPGARERGPAHPGEQQLLYRALFWGRASARAGIAADHVRMLKPPQLIKLKQDCHGGERFWCACA